VHFLPIVFKIEKEKQEDIPGIRIVNLKAFNNRGEADIVDLLRASSPVFLSLAAKDKESVVVGHILFTPVQIITPDHETISGMGLAPLAVLPNFQGYGIGSALCQRGLEEMSAAGYPFVVVLGHPGFYIRFGFTPANRHGIACEYLDVPDDAFMIKIFNVEMMQDVIGTACYRPEFNEIT